MIENVNLFVCEDIKYGECGEELIYGPCPYREDVHNEIVMVWLCQDHRWERGRDI